MMYFPPSEMMYKWTTLTVLLLLMNVCCTSLNDESTSSGLNNDSHVALHEAAKNGSVSAIQLLLNSGISVDQTDENLYTALLYAAKYSQTLAVEELLRNGADVNARNDKYNTALMYAANNGNLEILDMLLQKGADVNARNSRYKTALMFAAENGHLDVLKKLLQIGADANAKNENGASALLLATEYNYPTVVEELLDNGADPNTRGPKEEAPIHLASRFGYLAIVEKLLSKGADPNVKQVNGNQPLHYASMDATVSLLLEIVKVLIPLVSDINAKNNNMDTPLHLAAKADFTSVVKELLSNGADVNALNKFKETPLHLACFTGGQEVIKELLTNPAVDITLKTTAGLTVLHFAAASDHLPVVQQLLEFERSSHDSVSEDIQNNKITVLPHSLLEKQSFINIKCNKGRTALHHAASRGNMEMLKLMKSYGADMNVIDNENLTISKVAAKQGQFNLLEKLIFNEDEITTPTTHEKEWSPFHPSAWKVIGRTKLGRNLASLALVVEYCKCFDHISRPVKLNKDTVHEIHEKYLSGLSSALREKLEHSSDLDIVELTESEENEHDKVIRAAFDPFLGVVDQAAMSQNGEKMDSEKRDNDQNK